MSTQRRTPDPPSDDDDTSDEESMLAPRVPRRSMDLRQERVRLGVERPERPTLVGALAQLPDLTSGSLGGGSSGSSGSSGNDHGGATMSPPSPARPAVPRRSLPPGFVLNSASPAAPAVPRRSLPPDFQLNHDNPSASVLLSAAARVSSSSSAWQEITGNRPTIEQETEASIAKATNVSWETTMASSSSSSSSRRGGRPARRRDSVLDATGALSSSAVPHSKADSNTTANTTSNTDSPILVQPKTASSNQPYRPVVTRNDSFMSVQSEANSFTGTRGNDAVATASDTSSSDGDGLTFQVEDLQLLARDLVKDVGALITRTSKKIKTLPSLLEAARALDLDLDTHSHKLKSVAASTSTMVIASAQALMHTLRDAAALASRIGSSRRFNVDLPGLHSINRKFRNKVSRAVLAINDKKHGLITSIYVAIHDEDSLGLTGGIPSSASPSRSSVSATRPASSSSSKSVTHASSTTTSTTTTTSSSSSTEYCGTRHARQGAEERCMLGDRFFSGLGVEKNLSLAFRNYRLSADAGLVRAMNAVGCMFAKGLGVAASVDAAGEWYERAAACGDADGLYNMAMLLDDRVAKARRKLEAGMPNTEASRTGVIRTMREIERLLLDASHRRHPSAMNALGTLYEHADPVGTSGVVRDPAKALKWYKRAAERGHAVAQNNMGSFCFMGKPPMNGPDYVQAREWFEMAAAQSDPVAQNNLGILYENGRGSVTQDLAKASQLYARSAAQGNPSAMSNWGYMLVKRAEASGSGRQSQAFRRAALLFRACIHADGGWPEADPVVEEASSAGLDNAGLALSDFSHVICGSGSASTSAYNTHSSHQGGGSRAGSLPKHVSRGSRLGAGKGLRQTNADACFNLAQMYESGYGVERDLQAAFAYYRRAADNPERPHAGAACRTAAMLYSGSAKGSDEMLRVMRGGEESSTAKTRRLADAMHYYKKAAKLGSSDAENALGIMIEELGDVVHVRPGSDSGESAADGGGKGDSKISDASLSSAATADPGDIFHASAEPRFLGRDPSGAQIWYRRAAFNGNAYALLNLARLYAAGKGVEQQQAYACKLLQEAASKGVLQAEIELRLLQKSMSRVADSAEDLIAQSPHRFMLKPSEVSVASITPKDRPRAVQAARRANAAGTVAMMTTRSGGDGAAATMTTPPRQRRSGESKVSSPFTQAAEERLLALKQLLAE